MSPESAEPDLRDQLRAQTERVVELEATLRERMRELVETHEQVRALQADLAVKDAYAAELQLATGIAGPAAAKAGVWVADRGASGLRQLPRVLRAAKRLARRIRALAVHRSSGS